MFSHYNPFKENRAEQMRDLWKYYVPVPGIDEAGKPVVVVGGRGSGKTMLFQCNSWRQRLSQIRKRGGSVSALYEEYPFIGVYYRVDTTFVSSMDGRENDKWPVIFETYISICILNEFLDLLISLDADIQFNRAALSRFVEAFSKRFYAASEVDELVDFRVETESYLDRVEDMINGVQSKDPIRFVSAHRFITELCNKCNELFGQTLLFKIFIDEYETLQEYQQKIINTLIKHSSLPVIVNIGLRPEGMKTCETISITETIESPHDYEEITLGIDAANYKNILREICRKRIQLGKELGKIPGAASDDIEYYLGCYNIEDEIEKITSTRIQVPYLRELRDIIAKRGEEENLSTEYVSNCINILCDNAPYLNSRLHYILLNIKTHFTPSLRELNIAYTTNSKKYQDWMHNRKFGIVFLLAKDFKKTKMYYGFEVFTALSSQIVRYFLELCERAFELAFLDNYNWQEPISYENQTEAAKYVSEYKIVDIASYEPYGKELRIFIQFLGQIFYRLHTSPRTTLGEPEPNHFSTKDLTLSDHTKEILCSAIMWNVLQVGEPTKRKQSRLSPETVDFYLNKIYVPYFGISYRNQRKIQLDVEIIDQLLSGDAEIAKYAFQQYFRKTQDDMPPIEESIRQISLFEKF